jgi:Mannosylglycerate hydrolase MGH1-like glycoside hydrolase domain
MGDATDPTTTTPTPRSSLDDLHRRAQDVLDGSWIGASTLPSRTLYPHQWSWDSAFIAIGRSWYDPARAQQELVTLFGGQWANGMLPHIVFNPSVGEDAYFPGPSFWQSSSRSPHAPRSIETSGITQPPIHARAALEMHRHARDVDASLAFLRWLYPRLVAQHRYLLDARRPAGTRLSVMVHPWESGLDNSPAWDRALAELVIPPGGVPPYQRRDLEHGDPKDRPTNEAYDRFVYLAARYRDGGYDDARLTEIAPYLIAGPLFNGILAWSQTALGEIATIVGADPVRHREDAEAVHAAIVAELWDEDTKRMSARDVTHGERSVEDTIVSFAPLLDPHLPSSIVDAIVADLRSASFHPDRPDGYIVPSFDLLDPDFDERRYWRGPVWINTNWLLWSGLRQHGHAELAAEIATSSLRLVAKSGFHEYFDPLDGRGFGTDAFGWTAALTIDHIERLDERERARLEARLAGSPPA